MTSIKSAPTQASTGAPGAIVKPRDARLRLNDYYEVYEQADPSVARREGARCMNCGAAFCMPDSGYGEGCPIYNKIPEWNELVRLGRWRDAYDRLSLTNPFPEFTARVCPAPCQDACIVGINDSPVQIKGIERAIIDRAFDAGWVTPSTPAQRAGKRIAIIGSGPAGLAAADRLIRAGHDVTVYERGDRPGGLLMYGVPNMKLDKSVVDRRIALLTESGVRFEVGTDIGTTVDPRQLLAESDAVLMACGALRPRELDLPGRGLRGIIQAMQYLTESTRALRAGDRPALNAAGKHVVVIGAGDTGTDCVGTALRQGAHSVINLARNESPPETRDTDHPWPTPAGTLQVDYAHAEACAATGSDPRAWATPPVGFKATSDGAVSGVAVRTPTRGEHVIPANLVILSIGFTGHDSDAMLRRLGLASGDWHTDSNPIEPRTTHRKLFVAGDMRRGPSLVVHAIAEGIAAANKIHGALAAAR